MAAPSPRRSTGRASIWKNPCPSAPSLLRTRWLMSSASPRAKDTRVRFCHWIIPNKSTWKWLHAEMLCYRLSSADQSIAFLLITCHRFDFEICRHQVLMVDYFVRCHLPLAHAQAAPQDAQGSAKGGLYRCLASVPCPVHGGSRWSEGLSSPHGDEQEDLPHWPRYPHQEGKGKHKFKFHLKRALESPMSRISRLSVLKELEKKLLSWNALNSPLNGLSRTPQSETNTDRWSVLIQFRS